ncbi:hypothetical protein KFZ76_04110 [Methylovulum psychrotolerans]|uniref:hypothetical protein n=1 Tax=Methylovulum psychrotolerans TaxID=1704499 RepID=UPI001BFF3C67|nr:hypothetical protein [Methylovulum psychrotolerans]MBT9096896.1 hypothetical protein [Methylovulum psychrotolerans]
MSDADESAQRVDDVELDYRQGKIKELGIESSSQAVATALQIADYIRESTKKGEIIFKKDASGEAKTIKFIGL